MRKKILLFVLAFSMIICNFTGLTAGTIANATAASGSTTTTLNGSDLLYDLMETATSFAVVKHKALGGSHYAYTEGLYEESNGDAPMGTESNFYPGAQLVLLELALNAQDNTKVDKTETVLITMPNGVIRDPDVSADGKKILFSMKKARTDDFHIYEYDLETRDYIQLTFGSGVADFEAQYLPTGEIVFSSSRCIQTVDCWKTPVSNIYKMSADGKNIIRLGYDQVHTTYPTVTADGRVIYTRWDYNDRTQMFIQGLFQMNPDGTNQTELYGNNANFPTTLIHTRDVPGTSNLYISIATGHHTFQAGKLCFIDVAEGREDPDAVKFIFPDAYTNKNANVDAFGQSGALYQYPYAINEKEFLVSYSASGWASTRENTAFGIFLMNTSGQKIELVKGSAQYPAAQIIPIKTRDMFVRPSMVNYSMNTGVYYVANVYEGEAMEGVAAGSVKSIRVVALDYRAYAIGATVAAGSGTSDPYSPIATGNGAWDVKVVLGLATVYEDGSAMFRVPSETPVYFQLLDANGSMIQSMRSWSTLMPNETYSCVGCHEDNNTAPISIGTVTLAMKNGVEDLVGDVWTDDGYDAYTTATGFSYLETVQPILNNKCVSCHTNDALAFSQIKASEMNNSGVEATITGTTKTIFDITATGWKYKMSTSNSPIANWNKAEFDDSTWSTGQAPFGDRNENGVSVKTSWAGSNNYIWIRMNFNITDVDSLANAYMYLKTWYDDSPVYYLNGQQIFTSTSWVDNYTTLNLGTSFNKYLKEGDNVLAIFCKNTTGGRQIDSSLYYVIPDSTNADASKPISLEDTNVYATRMLKYFPVSYLVLTASAPNGGQQWVGNSNNKYTNWISSMSGAEVLAPNTYGSNKSAIIKTLREGHGELTADEIKTIAAWIDLGVPCYGAYDENVNWNADQRNEAEEEQNKRDYFNMLNDYARMSLAGTLPKGELKVTYVSGSKSYEMTAQGIATLYVPQVIKKGDKVTVTLPEGVKYIGFTLTPKMGEAIVYCPDGTFTYTVPMLTSLCTSISSSTKNTTNNVTARIVTDAEIAQERNLAENVYDYTNNTSVKSTITAQYPHIYADSEWENTKGSGNPEFYAISANDGFTSNTGHGGYPVQSWGPANTNGHWLAVDFGRSVTVKQVGIIIRYDVGHDTYFKTGKIEVTYADGTKSTQNINIEWTGAEQFFTVDATKAITSIKLMNLTANTSGGWAAITEFRVYGTEAK